MKGFIAVVLAMVPELLKRRLQRPIVIALSADEEIGVQGVGPMLDEILRKPNLPLFCIVGEPTRMRVAVAHKGKIALRVHVTGRAAHSSAAPTGVNAIAYAAKMINMLYEYQVTLSERQGDDRFAVPYPSVNVGRIDGGSSVNVVAERCVFDVEIRAAPKEDLVEITESISATAARLQESMAAQAHEATVTVEVLSEYPGLETSGRTPGLVAEFAGTEAGLAVDFGTEAGLYQQRLDVPIVVCGPGDVAQAHTVDEYIEKKELCRAQRFLGRLADWLEQHPLDDEPTITH